MCQKKIRIMVEGRILSQPASCVLTTEGNQKSTLLWLTRCVYRRRVYLPDPDVYIDEAHNCPANLCI